MFWVSSGAGLPSEIRKSEESDAGQFNLSVQAGHTGCLALVFHIGSGVSAWQLQCDCCPPCLFTWSLPLIMISEYDDAVFLYPL